MRIPSKFLPQSLPVRLSLYICMLLLCFGAVGMTLIGYFWYRGMAFTLDDHARTVAREISLSMDQVFVRAEQSAQILATAIEHCDSDQAEVRRLVASVLPSVNRHCGDIRGIAVAWREGQTGTAAKTGILFGYEINGKYHFDFSSDKTDYLYKDWFVIPATLGAPVWTIPYREKDGLNSLLVSYAIPFYKQGKNGRTPAGVVVVDICIGELAKHLNKNLIAGLLRLADKSHLFLMNQFGQLVIDPDMGQTPGKTIFTICDEPAQPDPQDRKEAQRIFRSGSGRISFTKAPLLDVPSQLYYHRCANGWVVSIVVPKDWMNGYLRPVFERFTLGWLVAIAIVAIVIIVICRRVNRPLLALSRAAEEVGRGNFDTQLPAIVVEDEIGRVTRSFGHMQTELADYISQLRQTVSARERAEGELNAAAQIQQGILPRRLPPFDGCEQVRASAVLRAARGVGGDLYDLFPLDRNNIAIIIGDVSGKGIPAALFMAVTETLQRVCAQADMDPGALATRLNSVLMANNEAGMFVTWWAGFLELSSGILTFTNAGHNPPLIRRANGTVERLTKRHGIPLAAMDDMIYKSSQITLGQGDTLVLYTDGVTEAFNTENEMFGDERLSQWLQQTTSETPQQLRDEIVETVKDFAGDAPQSDDITVLCAQYEGPPTNLWRKIELIATLENLPQIMAFVEEEPGFELLSSKGRNQLMVCIEEIYTNIVNYACGGQPITFECSTDALRDQVRVRFTDSGVPFNPLDQNPPNVSLPIDERPIGGLGIFIVRKWVDDLFYLRENDANILEIGKNISAASPPVPK